jgi:hypothetical protein
MKNKKYLVVCGDSFTEGHMLGERGSWAFYLAQTMNLKLINLAIGGMGNEWISNMIITHLNKKDIPLDEVVVMVAWSDVSRQMTYFNNVMDNQSNNVWHIVPGDLLDNSTEQIDAQHAEIKWVYENRTALYPFFSSLVWNIFKTYQSLFYTKMFLNSHKIPYLFFDTITDNKIYYVNGNSYFKDSWKTFWTENLQKLVLTNEPEIIQNMLCEKTVDYIFDKNYIDIDGKTIMQWLQKPENKIYEIGNEGHLNELGAKLVSDKIIKKFNEINFKK